MKNGTPLRMVQARRAVERAQKEGGQQKAGGRLEPEPPAEVPVQFNQQKCARYFD